MSPTSVLTVGSTDVMNGKFTWKVRTLQTLDRLYPTLIWSNDGPVLSAPLQLVRLCC